MDARKFAGGFWLRLDRGEEVIGTISDFVREQKIPAAELSGIGAVEDVTLGYFDRPRRTYDKKLFTGEWELVSLLGNVSWVNDEPMVHLHCVLGGSDHGLIGGHFFSGTVAVTGEIFLRVFDQRVERRPDSSTGLKLISF